VAATDDNGNVLWREMYTPFGSKMDNPAANRDNEGYTGHIDDSGSGLTYMQARFYDPAIGRFLSNDPVGFAQGGPAYFNRYAYVANDPMNAIDPNGKKIVIIGSEEYKEEVANQLAEIAKTSKGSEALYQIGLSENTWLIVEEGYEQEADEFLEANDIQTNETGGLVGSDDGSGGGSVTNYDPYKTTGGTNDAGSNIRPPTVGLAHELGHAVDNDNGNAGPPPDGEKRALEIENDVRQHLGEEPRSNYD